MKIAVTGGRDFANAEMVARTLSQFGDDIELCHGAARGADALCRDYALSRSWKVTAFPADWAKYGNRAGPIRNRQMADTFNPEVLVAFPGGKGTKDMVNYCKSKGIKVIYAVQC